MVETVPSFEHFDHQADVGIRGHGHTLAQAFEQAALALVAVVVSPGDVRAIERMHVTCRAEDHELLLLDWLNAVIYQMAASTMVFGEFKVHVEGTSLDGELVGERIDRARHAVGVEVKAATPNSLRVAQVAPDHWLAQCVVDV